MVLIRARDDARRASSGCADVLARLYDEPPAARGARARRARRPARARPRACRRATAAWLIALRRADHPLRGVDLLRAAARGGARDQRRRRRAGARAGRARSPTAARCDASCTSRPPTSAAATRGASASRTSTSVRSSATPTSAPSTRPSGCCATPSDLPLAVARPSIVVGDQRQRLDLRVQRPLLADARVRTWPARRRCRRPRGLDRRLRARRLRHRRHPRAARRRRPRRAHTTSSRATTRSAPASSSQLHSAVTGREPVRFVAQDDGEGASAAGVPAGGESFVPYFDVRCRFGDERARELLARAGVVRPDPQRYLARLIAYARASAWGKRGMTREGAFTAIDADGAPLGGGIVRRPPKELREGSQFKDHRSSFGSFSRPVPPRGRPVPHAACRTDVHARVGPAVVHLW